MAAVFISIQSVISEATGALANQVAVTGLAAR